MSDYRIRLTGLLNFKILTMTLVTGIALKTTNEFVKNYHENKYEEWFNSLPPEAKKFYSSINTQGWYPIETAYNIPLQIIIDKFYNGDPKYGVKVGIFSSEYALNGIYRVFLSFFSPVYLMNKASKILKTYYKPTDTEIIRGKKNEVTLRIHQFDEITEALEYRIAGWCKKTLEFAHCKEINYEISRFLTKGDDCLEIYFNWK